MLPGQGEAGERALALTSSWAPLPAEVSSPFCSRRGRTLAQLPRRPPHLPWAWPLSMRRCTQAQAQGCTASPRALLSGSPAFTGPHCAGTWGPAPDGADSARTSTASPRGWAGPCNISSMIEKLGNRHHAGRATWYRWGFRIIMLPTLTEASCARDQASTDPRPSCPSFPRAKGLSP